MFKFVQRNLFIDAELRRLWGHISGRRRKQLFGLSVLMVVASLAEVFSISSLVPFLAVITSPDTLADNKFMRELMIELGATSAHELLLPITVTFMAATIFAGLVRIALLRAQTHLSIAIGIDFSVSVYERTLYQPYSLHISRNSSQILAGTRKAESLVYFVIQPVLQILSSTVILAAVTVALVSMEPLIALTTFLGFGLIYGFVVLLTKRRISINSQIIASEQVRVTKAIQEGLGGIRDVLIDGTQSVYSRLYRDAFIPLQVASANNQVIGASPRFVVEALGMVLIAGLAYGIATAKGTGRGLHDVIPVLGVLALGAQRLLPILQQIYLAYITIRGNKASVQDALALLDQPFPDSVQLRPPDPILFQSVISFEDVGFRYTSNDPWVLRHLNLKIPKGGRIGFIGATGSGKSTLIDVVMGLLAPTEGSLLVDDVAINSETARSWQAHISHVPQAIFLVDSSIAENIALGVPLDKIDWKRLRHVAKQAQIADTINGWPHKYETVVGERGVRLSGGQRQRIGIARALYKQADVIILDEATSALDYRTEEAIMQVIDAIDRSSTILIVAHRLSTLQNCDHVVLLSNGRVEAIRNYEEAAKLTAC